MNIELISNELHQNSNGIWVSSKAEEISYTHEGHKLIAPNEKNSFWFQYRLRILETIVKKYPISSILDVGGGNGQITKFFQEKGVNSILLEPLSDGVQIAHSNGVSHIIQGTLKSAAINANTIDNIGLFDVLEHVENDSELLANIYNCLKPKGLLIITVPALPVLYSKFDKEVGHFRRYKLNSLSKKLENVGFQVKYKSYFFSFLPFIIFPARLLVYNRIHRKEKRRGFGHINKFGVTGKVLSKILNLELGLISKGKSISIGSSCLLVVQK